MQTFTTEDLQQGLKIAKKFNATNLSEHTGQTYQGSLVSVPIVDWYGQSLNDQ